MIDRVEEGLAFSDEALAALCAGELTELATIDEIFCGLFWSCELVNDVPRADQWIRAAAERLRHSNVVAVFCRAHYGGILTAAGRWQEAETELLGAVDHFDHGLTGRREAAVIRLANLRVRQGRLEEAAQLLEGLGQHPDAIPVLAELQLARGELAVAQELLERARVGTDDAVPTVGASTMVGPLLGLLVDVQLARGDLAGAERTAGRLDRVAQAQRGPYLRAVAALARGRVGVASGRGDARGLLDQALVGFAQAQLPMELARTRLELARALAEEVPGSFLGPGRDRWVVATKYTLAMWPGDPNAAGNSRKNLRSSVEASLRRLRTDYLDLLWVHAWDYTTPVEEVMRGLGDLVSAGATSAQVAVAWLRQRDRRVIPILGARKLEQFQDVLGSLEVGLAAEHVARLDEVSRIEFGFPYELLRGPQGQMVYGDLEPQIDLPSTAPYRWRAVG